MTIRLHTFEEVDAFLAPLSDSDIVENFEFPVDVGFGLNGVFNQTISTMKSMGLPVRVEPKGGWFVKKYLLTMQGCPLWMVKMVIDRMRIIME